MSEPDAVKIFTSESNPKLSFILETFLGEEGKVLGFELKARVDGLEEYKVGNSNYPQTPFSVYEITDLKGIANSAQAVLVKMSKEFLGSFDRVMPCITESKERFAQFSGDEAGRPIKQYSLRCNGVRANELNQEALAKKVEEFLQNPEIQKAMAPAQVA